MKNKLLNIFTLFCFTFFNLFIFFPVNAQTEESPLGEIIGIMGTKYFISAGENKNLKIDDEIEVKKGGQIVAVIKVTKVAKTTAECVLVQGNIKLLDKVFLKPKEETQTLETQTSEETKEEIKPIETKTKKEEFINLAILYFNNNTKFTNLNLEEQLLNSLYINLTNHLLYKTLSKEQITEKLQKQSINIKECGDAVLSAVTKLLATDFVIYGEIKNLKVSANRVDIFGEYKIIFKDAETSITTNFYGSSGEKIGFKGQPKDLILEAINDAGNNLIKQLPYKITKVENNIVEINSKKNTNLKIQDNLEVIKKGEIIGKVKVTEIKDKNIITEIVGNTTKQIETGDWVMQTSIDKPLSLSEYKPKKKNKFLIIAGATLVVGSLALLTTSKKKVTSTGSIEISSFPIGAKIYLDGVDTGKITNNTLTDVTEGVHTIKLLTENGDSVELSVTVEKNKTTAIPESEAILSTSGSTTNPPTSPSGW